MDDVSAPTNNASASLGTSALVPVLKNSVTVRLAVAMRGRMAREKKRVKVG